MPTIRADVHHEADQIKDAKFPNFYRIKEKATVAENAEPLAAFLNIPIEQAQSIAATAHLFAD